MNKNLLIILVTAALGFFWLVGCEQNSNAGLSPDKSNHQSLPAVSSAAAQSSTQIIAYYFHRTFRCKACITIETNAERTIRENFSKELADGRLTWMSLNLEERNGQKLAKEFDILSSTLVIAKMKGDNTVKYKKLEKVWELLGNPEEFALYITQETNDYLEN